MKSRKKTMFKQPLEKVYKVNQVIYTINLSLTAIFIVLWFVGKNFLGWEITEAVVVVPAVYLGGAALFKLGLGRLANKLDSKTVLATAIVFCLCTILTRQYQIAYLMVACMLGFIFRK